jgi:hypothetical protein
MTKLEPDQLAAETEMIDGAAPPAWQGMAVATVCRAQRHEQRRAMELSRDEAGANRNRMETPR